MSEAPKPLRVLYVVSLFPCWSETFIAREIASLIASGVDVRILSLKPPSEKLVQQIAVPLLPRVQHPLRFPHSLLRMLGAFVRKPAAFGGAFLHIAWRLRGQPATLAKSLVALARGMAQLGWIETFAPHAIHAHWATYPSTVAWALSRATGIPYGFTAHAHDIFVDDQLLKEKIETASVPITISRYNIGWLSEQVTPLARERLHIVHCGVDLKTTPVHRDGREARLLVAVGRLDPIKGFDVLVESLGLLHARGVDFRCRIIGEGPQRGELEAAIARLGLAGKVELAGVMPQESVQAALRAATVFVLPSVVAADGNRDGIPVALMEAMAIGTPVVSTRVSGIPELIEDGSEGLLADPYDVPALAAALERLLEDDELRAHLAEAGRRKIEAEFDAHAEAMKLLARLREAVAAHSAESAS